MDFIVRDDELTEAGIRCYVRLCIITGWDMIVQRKDGTPIVVTPNEAWETLQRYFRIGEDE